MERIVKDMPAIMHLLLAVQMMRFTLVLGNIGDSFNALATQFAGYLTGILAFVAVVSGYQLMTAGEDVQQATRAKKALGLALAGAVLVGTAVALAPIVTGNIK